jgi:hypothetical protein
MLGKSLLFHCGSNLHFIGVKHVPAFFLQLEGQFYSSPCPLQEITSNASSLPSCLMNVFVLSSNTTKPAKTCPLHQNSSYKK